MTYPDDEPSEWQPDGAADERLDEIDDSDDEADGASVDINITLEPDAALLAEAYNMICEAADDAPWNDHLQRCKRLLRLGIGRLKRAERG